MLYERWQEIARTRSAALAVRDLHAGETLTFRELAQRAEGGGTDSLVVHPQGPGLAFILAVLRAWRRGQVVCPLEVGQAPPALTGFPAGLAHLKITSASTGPARLVALTEAQLAADAAQIVETMGLRPDMPNVGVISLAHSYGFSNLVTPLLLHGIPLILAEFPLPEPLRRAAAGAESITLPAVPALWRLWLEARAIPAQTRLAISAGAPLPLALEQEIFRVTGVKVHNFYGASECGGIAYDDSSTPRTQAACVGRPLRHVEVGCAPDGCLQVRSPAVAQTYWPDPDPALAEGRYQTSDLAEIRSGLVYLRGRAGDQINVAGRKVAPESLERLLLTHPQVQECLVFGADQADARRGDLIVAVVVAKTPVSGADLRQFLLEHVPAWQLPREWIFRDALPVNARGKMSRREWRAQYSAGKKS